MSSVGLESIDHTVQLTHIWINDLDARLGWDNKHRSYRLLRTVLQAVRDWLPVNDAAGFGAQFPELLRGVNYEHWRPARTPVKQRSKADFIARIGDAFKADPFMETSEAITAVFELIPRRSRPAKSRACATSCRPTSGRCGRAVRERREAVASCS